MRGALKRFSSTKTKLCLGSVTALAVSGAVLVLTAGGSGAEATTGSHIAIAPDLSANVSVLSNASLVVGNDLAATPTLIDRTLTAMASPSDPRREMYGLDTAGTVDVPGSAGGVFLVPGATGACAEVTTLNPVGPAKGLPSRYGVCETTAEILRYGLIGTLGQEDGSYIVYGAVPNGVTQVQATMPDGTDKSFPVTDDVVDSYTSSAPSSLSFTTAAGATETIP